MDYERKTKAAPVDPASVLRKAEPENAAAENEAARFYDSSDERKVYVLADQIGHILQSDKVSDEFKQSILTVIDAAAFEAREGFYTNPIIVKSSFPVIIRSLDAGYRKIYVKTLEHAIESLPASVIDELRRYEKRFDLKNEHSNAAPEKSDLDTLAQLLSRLMHHPKMPARLYNAILNELTEIFDGIISVDNLLVNLKMQLEREEKSNQ
jgi:hypothetical protein